MTEQQQIAQDEWTLFLKGVREALPLAGGYIPIAISFGLVAVQVGLSSWEAVMVSAFIYAGGSQFLFVGMIASGAPLWLVVVLSLLINARHIVYGPNIAPWVTNSRWWIFLAHGLTDQVFAIAQTQLPKLPESGRLAWFAGLMLLAWISWIGGTVIGAFGGGELINQWPFIGEAATFALPALFMVLLAPLVQSKLWLTTLFVTTVAAISIVELGNANAAIPLSALLGLVCFYGLKRTFLWSE